MCADLSGYWCGCLVTKLCLTLVTLSAVACKAPLSMGFSRQEYWSGLPFRSPEDHPNPSIGPKSTHWQADSLPLSHQGSPQWRLVIALFACSVPESCLTLCDLMDCSTPGFPVLHCLPEFAHTRVHWVHAATQPSHCVSSPSPALSLSQCQGLSWWVSSSHQVARLLDLQLQHQSFQWIFRVDFL